MSVGFMDIETGIWGTGDEAQGKDNETYYFAGQELLEYSVVNIPSNAGAGKRVHELLRNQSYAALMYIQRELGKNYTLGQIENFRLRDILDLLDGKDLQIRETDPDKVRKMIQDEMAQKELNDLIEKQQRDLRTKIGREGK